MAATSVFPLPRCIVSSSSRFRAPRRKLQNTNICSSCRPDILMRLRPTYAGYCVSNGHHALLTHIWFLCDFFISLIIFLISEFSLIWNNFAYFVYSTASRTRASFVLNKKFKRLNVIRYILHETLPLFASRLGGYYYADTMES